jgi:hypothetical protein
MQTQHQADKSKNAFHNAMLLKKTLFFWGDILHQKKLTISQQNKQVTASMLFKL